MARRLLAASLIGATLPLQAEEWLTTSSLIGTSKYGNDFKHYDYVNPDAPKGGTLNSVASGTFDSFNPYIVQGSPAAGFVTLRRRTALRHADGASDRRAEHQPPADRRRLQATRTTFRRRSTGSTRGRSGTMDEPITADDVIWSFSALKANSPLYNKLLCQRHRGGGAQRSRGRVPFRPEGQSRTAAHPRRHAGAAEALVGRHGRCGQQARHHPARRWSRRWVRPPTRSRASSPAQEIVWERVQGLLGSQTCR